MNRYALMKETYRKDMEDLIDSLRIPFGSSIMRIFLYDKSSIEETRGRITKISIKELEESGFDYFDIDI